MKNGSYKDSDGATRWYKNGLRHREDGPAAIGADGKIYWYYNGVQIKTIRDFAVIANWSDKQLFENILKYGN